MAQRETFRAHLPRASANPIDEYTEMQETMMMGLRLLEEGVSSRGFEARFDKRLEDVFAEEISYLGGSWGLLMGFR